LKDMNEVLALQKTQPFFKIYRNIAMNK
jgi:hypothetical protein